MVLFNEVIVRLGRGRNDMNDARTSRSSDCLERLAISSPQPARKRCLNRPIGNYLQRSLYCRGISRIKKIKGLRMLNRAVDSMLVAPDHGEDHVVRSKLADQIQEVLETEIPYGAAVLLLEEAVGS